MKSIIMSYVFKPSNTQLWISWILYTDDSIDARWHHSQQKAERWICNPTEVGFPPIKVNYTKKEKEDQQALLAEDMLAADEAERRAEARYCWSEDESFDEE